MPGLQTVRDYAVLDTPPLFGVRSLKGDLADEVAL